MKKEKIKKIAWYVFLVVLWISVFVLVIRIPDLYRNYRRNQLLELIPQQPMYPAAEGIDYSVYHLDQSTRVEWDDENSRIFLHYADGMERVADFCTMDELKLLSKHVKAQDHQYGWINLHNGELFAVYTFNEVINGQEWYYQYYQHIVNVGTIYVYKERILPE